MIVWMHGIEALEEDACCSFTEGIHRCRVLGFHVQAACLGHSTESRNTDKPA